MKALVTGASGEIGRELAVALSKAGYDIIAHFNNGSVEKLEAKIKKKGKTVFPFKANLESSEQLNALAAFADSLGGADVLVNCAGMSIVGLFQNIEPAQWNRLLAVNLQAPVALTSLLLPSMLKNHFGSIVNISSIWGLYGAACEVHYSASKAGLIGFTKALAQELDGSGVTVNCICPGFVETKMNAHLSNEEIAAFLAQTPSKRAITIAEIAAKTLEFISNPSLNGEIAVME